MKSHRCAHDRVRHLIPLLALNLVLPALQAVADNDWKPAPARLMTPWAEEVGPGNALVEYPRPQMVRASWQNLNGLWDYAIVRRGVEKPEAYEGTILVPFPVESSLSGVGRRVGADNHLWYRRAFTPELARGQRLLLHFGAVDWHATVYVNGREVGEHKGGYDPFTFDITDALSGNGPQELIVRVWDPTNDGTQPRGKQVKNPGGIWYTPVTGIWQTVWLEPVPEAHIASLRIVPDLDASRVWITVNARGADGATVTVTARAGDRTVATAGGLSGEPIAIVIEDPELWAPGSPFLYDLTAAMGSDVVESYFGMRKIELRKDGEGVNRLFLNNEALFHYGLLDQGWWPDGLYTAPTDEALRFDIEKTLEMGFNMARKHVKIEPARWYYWADKLGLLVWQDMPNGDRHIRRNDPDIERTSESGQQFEVELRAMIDTFHNHPSIVIWVPYNEGWGQWDTARITDLVREWDPTRLIISASGWTDRSTGDLHDIHSYPGPAMPQLEDDRGVVLGEFGGIGVAIDGHLWREGGNWGYGGAKPLDELDPLYAGLLRRLRPMIDRGLAAAVYTQTTDVEIEVNGLMTYDRKVIKMEPARLRQLHRTLFAPPPEVKVLLPTSMTTDVTWHYTLDEPGAGWMQPGFDASAWAQGTGGLGAGVRNARIRTPWTTGTIWVRRAFEFDGESPADLHLKIYHDEDAEVYLNGTLVARTTGYTTDYVLVPVREPAVLKPGTNILAIHCKQTRGGQYIDAGLVDIIPQP